MGSVISKASFLSAGLFLSSYLAFTAILWQFGAPLQVDPLAGLVGALAVVISYQVWRYSYRQEKLNGCFRLLELWSSEYYRKCRNEAWYKIEAKLLLPDKTKISDLFGSNVTGDKDLSSQLWTVAHFLSHLGILYSNGLLDKSLATSMFANDVNEWIDLFSRSKLDWGNRKSWFEERIASMKNTIVADAQPSSVAPSALEGRLS